eukprot:CAMPEP_0183501932 /NCGR_PEP_ID=MMETSP0371-20130417/3850_1 /TAXON_ID=268820 /ORGANISM="Peridinium aciculiferum, Strain PAER-2" /LENGTH=117 /DNA_ID=CAMNT_0025696513 /DNA_START=62 /DNA_END=412 /DNA_ORIENTATION=+
MVQLRGPVPWAQCSMQYEKAFPYIELGQWGYSHEHHMLRIRRLPDKLSVLRRQPRGTLARLASRVDSILQLVKQDALTDGSLLEHGLQGVVQSLLGAAHVVSVQEVVLDLEAAEQVG